MAYPGKYSELSKKEKIIWLRKQREGLIIGDFRNCLYSVFMHIKMSCNDSETLSCIYEEVFSGIHIPGVFDPFECCLELCSLGYIKIHHMSTFHKLSVLKEIDF